MGGDRHLPNPNEAGFYGFLHFEDTFYLKWSNAEGKWGEIYETLSKGETVRSLDQFLSTPAMLGDADAHKDAVGIRVAEYLQKLRAQGKHERDCDCTQCKLKEAWENRHKVSADPDSYRPSGGCARRGGSNSGGGRGTMATCQGRGTSSRWKKGRRRLADRL